MIMTEDELRAIAWVLGPRTSSPHDQAPCAPEAGETFTQSHGAAGVSWALKEWKESRDKWRASYRYQRVGIDEDNGEGHGVWAVTRNEEATDTEYFENYREAYARWKQLWKERQ